MKAMNESKTCRPLEVRVEARRAQCCKKNWDPGRIFCNRVEITKHCFHVLRKVSRAYVLRETTLRFAIEVDVARRV